MRRLWEASSAILSQYFEVREVEFDFGVGVVVNCEVAEGSEPVFEDWSDGL